MSKNYLFKAKTVEAYTIKSLFEVLQNLLTDVCFILDNDGIRLLTLDNKEPPQLMVHSNLFGNSFDEYYCPNNHSIGINLQHAYKMLRSIKKKDNIVINILKNNPTQLEITTIQAESQQPVKSNIKIQKLIQLEADIPTNYGHPIHIPTGIFQKMCKDMQSISNKMTIYSKGNYLRFSCQVEGMYTRDVPFGELDEDSEEDEYEDVFHTKSLSQLIKISGLNTRMQVYIPLSDNSNTPLKIAINTGQLGKLEIFIKSITQLDS